MEAESQSLGIKTFDNKSILSFNYIYKKVKIKDNNEQSISELRTFNYEKIAKFKMKNMNLKFLLNSIFKLKNSINKNNPLLKYIQNFKPYNYPIIKLNISENEPLIGEIFKNKIKNNFPKKEKILNLFSSQKNFKNFYYSRMSNIEYKRINHNRNEKIILIQKHIRGFLSKKIFDEEINKIIAKKIIHKILIIQKAIRNFLKKKNSLSHLIVNIIQNERISKSNKIADIFSLYHFRNLYKKNLIIQRIIEVRHNSIILIQKNYKLYKYLKKVKEILKKERNSYVLTYPNNAQSVQIKIYLETSYKIYEYSICPLRNYFVLYIEKGSLASREYLCHMIVNGNIILDNRYKYIVDKNNTIYNLIYIGEPIIEKKPKIEINENLNINKIKIDKNEQKERLEKKQKKERMEKKGKKEKKEKKEIKDKKKKHKYKNDDPDNDFFIYCYNDNSNSTNSYSIKSENDKLKTDFEKALKKDENIINNINNYNQNINEFLKPCKKKSENLIKKNTYFNLMNINTGKNKKDKILTKKIDLGAYFKKKPNKNDYKENNNNKVYLNDNQNSSNEGSSQNKKINYSNILDELSQSISSSSKSTFSMKNLNSYSKKTHQTKFCSNHSVKNNSKEKVKNPENANNKIINISNNSKNKRIKIKK